MLTNESKRANTEVSGTDAYQLVSEFRWSSDSTRFSFGVEHGAHDLYAVVAYPGRRVVESANISRACVPDCASLRMETIEFSKTGLEIEIVGLETKNGQKKHLTIPERELVSDVLVR